METVQYQRSAVGSPRIPSPPVLRRSAYRTKGSASSGRLSIQSVDPVRYGSDPQIFADRAQPGPNSLRTWTSDRFAGIPPLCGTSPASTAARRSPDSGMHRPCPALRGPASRRTPRLAQGPLQVGCTSNRSGPDDRERCNSPRCPSPGRLAPVP